MKFDRNETNQILDEIKKETAKKQQKLSEQKHLRSLSNTELEKLARKGHELAKLTLERRKKQQKRKPLKVLQAKKRPPAPVAQPFGVSHQGAEALCAAWMRHLGALDAQETRASADGGIDILSNRYIAQVKNYSGSVGAPEVQQLAGIASVDKRIALFFTSGTYTFEAISFANRAGIPLLVYLAEKGSLKATNKLGHLVLEEGLKDS